MKLKKRLRKLLALGLASVLALSPAAALSAPGDEAAPEPVLALAAETGGLSVDVRSERNDDGSALFAVRASNSASVQREAAVIITRYSGDGLLAEVGGSQIKVEAGKTWEETFPVPAGEGYSTLMVWDSMEAMTPLSPKLDSRYPTCFTERPSTKDAILIPALERSIAPSGQQDGNEAVNMLTCDPNTRWSAPATAAQPASAVVDLGDLYDLHTLGLGFYQGNTRRTLFAMDVSDDGQSWSTVVSNRYSSGDTTDIEYYSFAPVPARYVRIRGYGWVAVEGEEQDSWFSVTAFEAYGGLSDSGGTAPDEFMDFEGLSGTGLTVEPTAKTGWGAAAMNEMTYTNYTPALGGSLYADIAPTPLNSGFADGNTALRLYDDADRDGTDGAGSVGAYHRLALPSDRYVIRFKWYVPTLIAGKEYNPNWAGLTLSSGRIKGGADTGDPVALQLRLEPNDKNRMVFNIMRTITYNEGNMVGLLGTGTGFETGCIWDVMLEVDGGDNSVAVTVSDGKLTESAYVRYNLYNNERTLSQTWANAAVDHLMFNTGAGGRCEMYIDDLSVKVVDEEESEKGRLTFSQDYEGVAVGTQIRSAPVASTSTALIRESGQSYTPSYGPLLDVSVANQSMTGGRALYLKDQVTREGNSVLGLGGVFAYVDIGKLSTANVSNISFDMYAPTAGEYSGFALGSGHNSGDSDKSHPLALQVRFSPQSEGMQLNDYPSIQYNKSSWRAFVGKGSNRLKYGAVWHFDITYNPNIGSVTVSAFDGTKTSTGTVSLPVTGEGGWKADWSKTPVDTLIFNTGVGTKSEIYIDNIEVYDTGVIKNSFPAVNGIVRYENEYGTGSGNKQGSFLLHGGKEGSLLGIARNQDPYYSRFVERRGLADPDSVSIEVIDLPNCYLVPVTDGSGTIVTVQRYKDTEEFRRRATFNKVVNLAGAGNTAWSYQWYKNPELYMRNDGNYLHLTKSGDSGVNKACTFHLRNEANSYVSDSFDGGSLSGQWYKGYPWYADYHNHSAVHRDQNVVVSNGRVLLKATKVGSNEWIRNSAGQTGYNDSINGNTWKKYCAWTGVISVNSKVYNKGSYIEGSFRQPNSPRGYWTAFWLNGKDNWPPETDMFEYLSSHGTSTWYTATHGGNEGAGWISNGSVGNMRTKYNTFAIDWGYNYIKMYVNGHLYFDRDGTSDVDVQKNMYLILNTGIGAWEKEPDSSTVWDQGLECQWLRSFQYY